VTNHGPHTDADGHDGVLSDFEFSMIVSVNGFLQWVVHCAEAAGARGLSSLDVLVLHMVNHRARDKKLSDICLVMNIEDTHTVAYSLKKLEEQGYVTHKRNGRDRIYCSSADGDMFCDTYRKIRHDNLVAALEDEKADIENIAKISKALTRVGRYYLHASRIALVSPKTKQGS
jgi:predicted MarR family transcription regulator